MNKLLLALVLGIGVGFVACDSLDSLHSKDVDPRAGYEADRENFDGSTHSIQQGRQRMLP